MKPFFLTIPKRRLQSAPPPERGSVMLLTAIVLVALLGMLALAIDLGFMLNARTQLQNAVDAAALAGAAELRTTIEADGGASPERNRLVKDAAKRIGGLNQVGRYINQEEGENKNAVQLADGDINVLQHQSTPDAYKVRVGHALPVPLFFAGLFGLYEANVSAGAFAATAPVDGGTGGMSGCWRPLMLPDTFFDAGGAVHVAGDRLSPPEDKIPHLPGDYYRSRFAAGGRNLPPYLELVTSDGGWVTGLRDTQQSFEISTKTVMGAPVRFAKEHYRIPNFGALTQVNFDSYTAYHFTRYGYCGSLRVGMDVPVHPVGSGAYDEVRMGLEDLKQILADQQNEAIRAQFHYITSGNFPAPNTHQAIIPVLLFNPFYLDTTKHPTEATLRVTNIGLFFVDTVQANGDLTGYFVRENFSGGRLVEPANLPGDSVPSFKRSWLPVTTRLLK